jgi:signal transduction histidine kinase
MAIAALSSFPQPIKVLFRLALVALAYFLAARLSLNLALVHGQVTPIWPPTGIALVAFLVLGRRVWPAILVAAFAVNLPLGPSPLGAALIAAGNTLAPLTAAELLRRVGFHLELDRLRDAISIIFLGALAGMAISATVGTTVLILSGSVASGRFAETWAVWWTGDAMGVLLVAPFLLSLLILQSPPQLTPRMGVELSAILVVTAVVTYTLFLNDLRFEYLVLPLIMLAAWRFRLRGAAPAALIASVVAIVCAVNGLGPFAEETLFEKMATLQVFNVSLALASFVLASFVETRERKEEVARLYASAQAASEAKSRFLHLAAHELRTPITVLTGYLSLLSDGSLGAVPAGWKSTLETLSSKTKELNRLVADLLEASRIEANAAAVVRSELDLHQAIEEAKERARPRGDLLGAEISTSPPAQPVVVEADAIQVGRILDNLINNGLTYTTRTPRLTIAIEQENHHAVVRIEDNGIGIAAEERERVFDQFHRTNDPLFANVPGTGLGLYISRQLAVANGGRLDIERSAPGEGTVFALTLPVASANGKTASGPQPGGVAQPEAQIAPSDAIGAAQR